MNLNLQTSLAIEDTHVEFDLLPFEVDSVLSVCGSGSRAIPLLAKNPKELHLVDASDIQLRLFRLRYHACKYLDYADYLHLLGYLERSRRGYTRPDMISKIHLTTDDMKFWKEKEILWAHHGFIYLGKWEKHLMLIGRIFQSLTFSDLSGVFTAPTLQARKYYLRAWKPALFRFFLKLMMNPWLMSKLHYQQSYANPRTSDFVFQKINDLLVNTDVKDNYFLSLIFENKVTRPESLPLECREDIYKAVKASHTRIFYYTDNLTEVLKQKPHNFYSLSHPETFDLSALPVAVATGSVIVLRTFMHVPALEVQSPWTTNPTLNDSLSAKDCTHLYEFVVLKKES